MLDRKITYFPFPTNQDSLILKEILMSSGLTSDYFKTDVRNNYEYIDIEDTMLRVALEEHSHSKIKKYTLTFDHLRIAETIEKSGSLEMKLIQTTDRYLPNNLVYVPQLEELYSARYKFTNQIVQFLQSLDIPKTFTIKMENLPVWSTTVPNGLKISLINAENNTKLITIEISSSPKKDLLVNMQSHGNNYRIEYSNQTYWKDKVINQVKNITKDILLKMVNKNLQEKRYCGFKPGFLMGKRF